MEFVSQSYIDKVSDSGDLVDFSDKQASGLGFLGAFELSSSIDEAHQAAQKLDRIDLNIPQLEDSKKVYESVVLTYFLNKEAKGESFILLRLIYKIIDFISGVDRNFSRYVDGYKSKFSPSLTTDTNLSDLLEQSGHAKAAELMYQKLEYDIKHVKGSTKSKEFVKKAENFSLIKRPCVKIAMATVLDNLHHITETLSTNTFDLLFQNGFSNGFKQMGELGFFITREIDNEVAKESQRTGRPVSEIVTDETYFEVQECQKLINSIAGK